MVARRRLDRELVARGLAGDLEHARRAIDSRTVLVDGAPGLSGATLVAAGADIRIRPTRRYVSRAGEKLDGALEDFCVDVTGMRCLDAGAGSGGFTDCLLQAGAAEVTAVDVGYGQFDWSLRRDHRVRLLERTNLRSLAGVGTFDLITSDLSFVALQSMAPTLANLAAGVSWCVLLVKPQFEAAPRQVERGGLVTDRTVWREVLGSVAQALEDQGLGTVDVSASRIKGATGNQEFFLLAVPGAGTDAGAPDRALEAIG